MKKADIFLLVLPLPLIPAAIMGFTGHGWFYFLTVFTFYVCFGLFEWISVKTRKKSISREIADTPTPLFWAIIVTWTLMQVGITVHWVMMR